MLHNGDDSTRPSMPWTYDLLQDLYTPPIPLTSVRPGEQGGYVFYTQYIPEKYEMPLPAEGWHVNSYLLDAMKITNKAIQVFTAFRDRPIEANSNREYREFYDQVIRENSGH